MIHIITWHWGNKYGPEYTARLAAGVRKHVSCQHTFQVVQPLREDMYLTYSPGCFVRLRMFDPEWQKEVLQVAEGDQIICMDLDSVVTGPLDPLFNRPETFLILQGANSLNPCPFNGSLMMLRAGNHANVWRDFSLDAAQRIQYHAFPDDQGWIWHKMPDAGAWHVGPLSGVYAFKKPGWPPGDDLPRDARLVVFPGWRDPVKFANLPWIKNYWVNAA